MSGLVRVFDGIVFRSGSMREKDMTPRPDRDVSSDLSKAGLSAWRELDAAIKVGSKGVKIDVAKLDASQLGCFQDSAGHVSIVPVNSVGEPDMITLVAWAETRESDVSHPLTALVMEAIIEKNVRRPS